MKIKQKANSESSLYAIWRGLCLMQKTTTDHRLRGIFAGQLNTSCGPDYQGAEFDLDGKRHRGDVEIHFRIQDWYAHGHHLDRRYDGVSLHLTSESNITHKTVSNSKGLQIPNLSFQDFPHLGYRDDAEYSCRASQNCMPVFKILRSLAGQRFVEKKNMYRRIIAGDGFDQGLYRLVFRMLGRGQNSDIYERLALMLPWPVIQQLKHRYHPDLEFWQNTLLTFAGMQNNNLRMKQIFLPGVTDQPPIPKSAWQLSGLRPPAHPVRRLKGMAKFIYYFKSTGLFEAILEKSMQRLAFDKLFAYYHCLLSIDSHQNAESFWGENLAIELTGNVILPALHHYAELTKSIGFIDYIEDMYHWLPAPPVYGVLQGFQKWPEFSDLEDKFYIRQALLWLKYNNCNMNLCAHCPLGRFPESV